jgi:mRNA interferase RelE/StbE
MAEVKITTRCLKDDLPGLPKNIQEGFFEKIEILRQEPLYGKPLWEDLKFLCSLRLGRYRIVYYYVSEDGVVWIIAVGIRKEGSRSDIYAQVSRLLRSGKLDLE